jgi:hypothetical protein
MRRRTNLVSHTGLVTQTGLAMRGGLIAVATLGAAGMLLVGCGGGSAQPPAALPAGSASGVPAGVSASATASVAGQIPADYKVDIEMNPTGNATQDALLAQTRAMLMAYEQAVSRNSAADGLYQSLTTANARINLYSMVNTFALAKERPTGSVRFYKFTATTSATVADVLFCEDTSKVVPVDFKTGQKTGAAATGTAAFSSWDTGFKKGSGGTWTIVYAAAQVGRQSCM